LANRYRAILFDVGWTLVYPHPERRRVLLEALAGRGYEVTSAGLESGYRAARAFYEANRWQHQTPESLVAFWQQFYSTVLAHLDAPVDDRGLAAALAEEVNEAVRYDLYPDTLPALEELRRNDILLGVVSNWSTDLPALLDEWGLAPFFTTIVVSDVVGSHKPQPQMFRIALERLDVPPGAALHVGDDYDADVQGARAAGITPVYLNRSGRDTRTDCPCIPTLRDLLPLTGMTGRFVA
jgi:putative hydrolase of the HAD superfamily